MSKMLVTNKLSKILYHDSKAQKIDICPSSLIVVSDERSENVVVSNISFVHCRRKSVRDGFSIAGSELYLKWCLKENVFTVFSQTVSPPVGVELACDSVTLVRRSKH